MVEVAGIHNQNSNIFTVLEFTEDDSSDPMVPRIARILWFMLYFATSSFKCISTQELSYERNQHIYAHRQIQRVVAGMPLIRLHAV